MVSLLLRHSTCYISACEFKQVVMLFQRASVLLIQTRVAVLLEIITEVLSMKRDFLYTFNEMPALNWDLQRMCKWLEKPSS